MHHDSKQHNLWLLAAIAAPAAHFSGSGWFTAALTAVVILPLMFLPKNWEGTTRPMAILQILWLGIVAGTLLPNSAAYWPSDNNFVVPLTLLTLAAFTDAVSAPRIGAVLALCMALLSIPTAISGASHLEWTNLKPQPISWSLGLALTLLIPNLPSAGERRKGRRVIAAAVLTVTLSALVQGILSAQVSAGIEDPFYQTARTLGHMEPIVAAGVTLGWYSLTAMFFHSGAVLAGTAGIKSKMANILLWVTGAGIILLPQMQNASLMTALSLFWWVIVPFLQKLKKVKNSA